MTGVFVRRGKCHVKRQTQREHQMVAEAEVGVAQLQASEHQGLTATTSSQEEAREDPPLQVSEGVWPCR